MLKILFFLLFYLTFNSFSFSYELQFQPNVPDKINVNLSWKKLKTYLDYINELKENPKSPINEKYKNFFTSKVYFKDLKNELRILPASSRITGDWQDHIDFKKNISSLKIKLRESNIGNIVKFRLLLPSSRDLNAEIFTSSLFEALGYPSLYRKIVEVSINGLVYEKMIFEESPVKEFLERNGYRESPIIEFDERQFWFKLNKLAEICSDKFSSRVASEKFIKCYKKLESEFLKENQSIFNWKIDNASFLKNKIANSIAIDAIFLERKSSIIQKFDNLSKDLGLEHSISEHNRKFIFDPTYKKLIPFYFDGNASIKKIDEYCKKIKNNKNIITSKIYDKKIKILENMYEKRTGETITKSMQCVANKVLANEKNYFKKDDIFTNNFLLTNYIYKKSSNPFTKKIIIDKDMEFVKICKDRNDCLKLNDSQFSTILAGNYDGDLVGNNIFFPEIIIDEKKIKINKNIMKTSKNFTEYFSVKKDQTIYINVSKETKELELLFEDTTSKIVIYNSELDNIKINMNFKKKKNEISKIRYDNNLLTGCLTIIDSKLNNVNLSSRNAQCEDAINIIRSSGTINKVFIKNSASDALDLDFTRIKIQEADIDNSLNDCIDFSGGDNEIIDAKISNCGDKGLSFGEKTKSKIKNILAIKNNIDISIKDDSEVEIYNFLTDKKDGQVCGRIENKKQEFGSGTLIIPDHKLPCKFITDKNSKIINYAKN